jgi:hypothetical protein
MHESVEVAVADLLLDEQNARLGEEQPSQQAIYLALGAQQGKRLIKLAEDIVDKGLDPTTLPAVVAVGDRRKRYKVIEGNRRILVLKALETPGILSTALSSAEQRRLQELSVRYLRSPVESVNCILFDTEAEAIHWVQMRHTGSNEGAGLVEWDTNEKDRFIARHGSGKQRNLGGQVLDFLVKIDGPPPGGDRKILTNVQRLINTKDVRETLGLERVQGQLLSRYPTSEVVKGLRKIVGDLRSGAIKVNDIYYRDDQLDYLKKFDPSELPDPAKELQGPVALEDLAVGRTAPARPKIDRKKVRRQTPRSAVIPGNCVLNVTPPRINAIFNELLTLNVDQYPNAAAVLLRVFLELSVDHEIDRQNLMTEQQRRNTPLHKRLKTVAGSLKASGRISDQLHKAIEKVADGQNVIAASSFAFNQYVHNQYAYPQPSELRTAWDELQPFVEKLWV